MNVLFDGNVFIEPMKQNVKKQSSDELKRNRNDLKWRWKDEKLKRRHQSMSFQDVKNSIDELTDEIHKQNNKDIHFINSIFPTNQKWKWFRRWLEIWMREWKPNQTLKRLDWSRRRKKKWMMNGWKKNIDSMKFIWINKIFQMKNCQFWWLEKLLQ